MASAPLATAPHVAAGAVASIDQNGHYVDWPAILAGAVVAWAIAFVFGSFGSGIGLSMAGTPWQEGASPTWFLVAAALWFIWVQISSVMAGGYLAGRLRRRLNDASEHEVEVRDSLHGLLVWGVSALAGAVLAFGVAATGIGATGSIAGGVAKAGAMAANGDASGRQLDYVVDRLFREPFPAVTNDAAATQPGATAPAATDGNAAASGTVGKALPADTGNGSVASERNGRQSVRRIADVTLARGDLSADDRSHIASLVAAETGLSPELAQARVDNYLTAALAEIRRAAETARKTGIVIAFLTAATLLVSALGGWWAAGVGGQHRDRNVDMSRWFRFR